MSKVVHQPHDSLFKAAMEDKRVARDFFEAHLPPDILKRVDLNTLEIQKNTFISAHLKKGESDLIYAVDIKGSLAYLFILCEHQSTIEKTMALRLLSYQIKILEGYLEQHPDELLPLIFSFVVYTGETPWNAPREIGDLFGEYKELAKEFLVQPYTLVDVCSLPDDELKKHQWIGLVEFAIKYREARDFKRFLQMFTPWVYSLELSGDSHLITAVLTYSTEHMDNANLALFDEEKKYFSESLRSKSMTLAEQWKQQGRDEAMTLAEQWKQQGRDEAMILVEQRERDGFEKGIETTRREVARELIASGFSLADASKVTKLSVEELERI